MPPKQRKLAIMGFRSVGKSSLTIQFVEGQFVDSYDPTIENTFNKSIRIGGCEYMLQLVDTAGQDEYSIFPQSYSMNIDGYVLVYSVNSRKSFEVVQVIHDKILDMTGKVQVPVVLVGNKSDLRMERCFNPATLSSSKAQNSWGETYVIKRNLTQIISAQEGKKLADQWKAGFCEASAKENTFVKDIFESIVTQIEIAEGNVPEKSGCSVS